MRISIGFAVAAVSLLATTALADGVGKVLAVTDTVNVFTAQDMRTLTDDSELFVGDVVETGAGSEAQLLFKDDTKIALSSDTVLEIKEFLDDPAKDRVTLSLVEGSVRVIVGEGNDESKYAFLTKWATVIPLGTAFDLTALPNGRAELLLLRGKAKLCDRSGDCKTIEEQCEMLEAEPGQNVAEVEAQRRVPVIRDHFPYIISQATLLEPFKIEDHGCNGLAALPLDQSAIRTPVLIGTGTVILCILLCPHTDGNPPIDTNNNTN